MKLGELLMQRADLNKRIGQVEARLKEAVLVQEGDDPDGDPTELLVELNGLYDQMGTIVSAINGVNATATMQDGTPLGEALLLRNMLGKRIKSYQQVIGAAGSNNMSRYSRNEIKFVKTVDLVALQKHLDSLSRQHRDLDVEIQQRNWELDIS